MAVIADPLLRTLLESLDTHVYAATICELDSAANEAYQSGMAWSRLTRAAAARQDGRMRRGDRREGRGWRIPWGVGLVTTMLIAELALAFARPVYFVSLGLSVLVVVAYRFRPAAHAPLDATVYGFADTTAGWSYGAPARGAPAARRRGCVLMSVVALAVIGAVVLALELTSQGPGQHAAVLRRDALTRALQRVDSALPNDLQNYTITIGLDTRTGVWKLSHPVILVRAGSRAHARSVARAMAAAAWKADGRALGSDGNQYLRFEVSASASVPASLPSTTNWNPATAIPLGIPNSFPLGPNSQAVIDAPSGLVSATEPAFSSESPLPTGAEVSIVVPITPDVQGLSVTLIGWVYRHPLVKFLGNEGLVILLPTGVVGSVWAWWRKKRRKGASSDHDSAAPRTAGDDPAADPSPAAS